MVAAGCSLLVLLLSAPPQVSREPTTEEVQRAIERLGSDHFAEREKASQFLWAHGRSTEGALEHATTSGDLEIRLRARAVLDKLRDGIFPDTPEEIVTLIQQFRYGDPQGRQAAWGKLKELGQFEVLLRLSEYGVANAKRTGMEATFLEDAHLLAQKVLIKGDYERAKRWLSKAARHPDPAPRHYAAFCLLRGELADAIRQAEASGDSSRTKEQLRVRAHLWRLNGDLRQALTLSEQAGDEDLIFDLLYRLEDWTAIIDRQLIPGDEGLENLGFAAAFHDLAGNEGAVLTAIRALKDLPLERSSSAWMHGEALMINDQWDDALELYRKHSPLAALRLVLARRQYGQAFRMVGYTPRQKPDATWRMQFEVPPQGDVEPSNQRFYSALELARSLNQIGLREESKDLVAQLSNSLFEVKPRMAALANLEWKLGLQSQAWQHAAQSQFDPPKPPSMDAFFPNRHSEVNAWWQYFSTRKEASPAEILASVHKLMSADRHDDQSQADFQALVKDVLATSQSLESHERIARIDALIETCLSRQARDLAVDLLKHSAELKPRAEPFVRLGDLSMEQGDVQEAIDWYGRAFEKDQTSFLALFLKGRALVKADDAAAGERAIELASLLPLGDVAMRNRYAEALRKRGYAKEAAEQYELILRFASFSNWEGDEAWAISDASQHLGNYLVEQDPMRAAKCWQRLLHGMLKTNTGFTEPSGYVQVVQRVHKSKARGSLQQGAHESALREIRLADSAMPGNIALAVDIIPLLDQAGLKGAGDELFESIHLKSEELQRFFPDRPGLLNNLAWLGARCRRRLPESFQLAQRAVELDPSNAAYVDTLAEVLYQQGDYQRALEQAEKCVQLAPESESYRQRLERIRQRRP